MAPQKTVKLNTGASFPVLGFGTYDSDPSGTYKATLHALKTGWRHLDTASGYNNEEAVGKAIKDFLAEDKSAKREDIFVTTKLNNHLHAPEDVEWAIDDSLQKLALGYVDLFLVGSTMLGMLGFY